MSTVEAAESKVNGRWTKNEHQKFIKGLQLYGKNWKKIQEIVGTRNGSQIRSHAQKFFLKVKKTLGDFEKADLAEQSFSEAQPSKILQRKQTMVEQNDANHSFFMSQIILKTCDQPELNFWDMFIDIGDSKVETETVYSYQRKGSFALLDYSESKLQSPIYYLGN